MRGSLIALHVLSKMIKRHKIRKKEESIKKMEGLPTMEWKIERKLSTLCKTKKSYESTSLNENKVEGLGGWGGGGLQKNTKKRILQERGNKIPKIAIEDLVIPSLVPSTPKGFQTTSYTTTPNSATSEKSVKLFVHKGSNTRLGQDANKETIARRKVLLNRFLGKDHQDLQPNGSMLWGFKNLPSSKKILEEAYLVYDDVDEDDLSVQLRESTAPSFCTMLLARFIQEHEVLELYFINDRWLTRVHRSVIFLARIAIKISVVGTFFIIKNNSEGFWDSFAAIALGFLSNKILGGFIKLLFVMLAKKRRQYTLNKYIRKTESAKLRENLPDHERHRNEHEILTLKLEENIDSDKHWTATKLSEYICCPCCRGCKKNVFCLDVFSAVVWLIAIGSILFCLFFGVMFAFALENETLAAAWLESVIGSIIFWLLISKPIVILIKTIIAKSKANRNAKNKRKEIEAKLENFYHNKGRASMMNKKLLEMTVINRTVAGDASGRRGSEYVSFRSDIEAGSKQRNEVAEVILL